jgi:hypothetical protein
MLESKKIGVHALLIGVIGAAFIDITRKQQ